VTLLIRAIVNPLRELQSAAETIAQGDISHEVAISGSDEIGQLGKAFGQMSVYLTEMADAADAIAAGHLAVDVRTRSENDRADALSSPRCRCDNLSW
jgi:methyl-accepting chemotaxis protein